MGLLFDFIGIAADLVHEVKGAIKEEVPSYVDIYSENEEELNILMNKWISIFKKDEIIPIKREQFSGKRILLRKTSEGKEFWSLPFDGTRYIFDNNSSFSYATIKKNEQWEHPLTNYYLEFDAGEKGVLTLHFSERCFFEQKKMNGWLFLQFKHKDIFIKNLSDIRICSDTEDIPINYCDYKIGFQAFLNLYGKRNAIDAYKLMIDFNTRLKNSFAQEDIEKANYEKRQKERAATIQAKKEERKKQEEELKKKQEEEKELLKQNKLKAALDDF